MIIAGPCSVEGENFIEIALEVKRLGATHLRGGIFKPRSSPKRFNGLGIEGLEFVVEAKKQTGLPFVSEAMSPQQIEILYDYVDIFQIGTRNQTASCLVKSF
jgi:3-deoxy-7-phosphoheptulonate synthase